MAVRGIRGAVNVRANTAEEICAKTQELLRALVGANRVKADDIAAALFTMTPDLDADFPAHAARRMGWTNVPMICSAEIGVPASLERVIRVLLLVNSDVPASRTRHQYLGDTSCLRPDLAKSAPRDGRTSRSRSSRRSSASTKTSGGDKR